MTTIARLKMMARAYKDACENDYCTDEFEEFQGNDPGEIAGMIVQEIENL